MPLHPGSRKSHIRLWPFPWGLLDNLDQGTPSLLAGRGAQDRPQGVGDPPLLADQLSHVRRGHPDLEDHGVLALGRANGHQLGHVDERLSHTEEQFLETVPCSVPALPCRGWLA
jgi:hypothetical protein